ncbi:MAG: type II toxin-antitoxin system HicA family toxin [Anaerolineae bacterium]|nr:type II toxin-antitoxin system HicA family toxin [Anaerolineae bacterium]
MKIRDIIKLLETDGWYLVSTEGSHRQFKHLTKKGKVTISGKPGDDVRKGTLNNILKQAGLKNSDIEKG